MSEQKYLECAEITPKLTDEQADVLGILSFSFAMNQRLTECRQKGKGGWHRPGSIDPLKQSENEVKQFKADMQIAMDEGRMVDVANYAMMIYHREKEKN